MSLKDNIAVIIDDISFDKRIEMDRSIADAITGAICEWIGDWENLPDLPQQWHEYVAEKVHKELGHF